MLIGNLVKGKKEDQYFSLELDQTRGQLSLRKCYGRVVDLLSKLEKPIGFKLHTWYRLYMGIFVVDGLLRLDAYAAEVNGNNINLLAEMSVSGIEGWKENGALLPGFWGVGSRQSHAAFSWLQLEA